MKKISVYSDGRTMFTQIVDGDGKCLTNVKRLVVDFDAEQGFVLGTLVTYRWSESQKEYVLEEQAVQIQRLMMEPGNYAVPCQV